MTEKEAYIAFNMTENIGSVGVSNLVGEGGSVAAAWEAYPAKTARSGGAVDVALELKKAAKYGVEIVTPADEKYPKRLLERPGYPLALYVKGDVDALSLPSVAMVGTRRATPYGLDRAFIMAEDLAASGMAVVSGLALGVDAESHKGALAAGGRTVGVIGSALDEFYPEENRLLAREIVEKGGAVASEFPFGRRPDQKTFPQRNRIVAALSRGVVVVESPLSGGSLITADAAADMGITVMAVPGRVDSRSSAGCLKLIRDGAKLVRDARDVLEEIGGLFPEIPVPAPKKRARRAPSGARSAAAMTAEEALLMKHVDAEGVGIDELVRLTGLGAAQVNATAMTLRIKGLVRFFPGNRIALPRGD